MEIPTKVLIDMLEKNQWSEKLDIITMRIIERTGGDETIEILSGVLADLAAYSPIAQKAINQLFEIVSRTNKR
jgi:hypothetical protein